MRNFRILYFSVSIISTFFFLFSNPVFAFTQYYSSIDASTGIVGTLIFKGTPNTGLGYVVVADEGGGQLNNAGGGTNSYNSNGEFNFSGVDMTNFLWYPSWWTAHYYVYILSPANYSTCVSNLSLCASLADSMADFNQYGTYPTESWDTPVYEPPLDFTFTGCSVAAYANQIYEWSGTYSTPSSTLYDMVKFEVSRMSNDWSATSTVSTFAMLLDNFTYINGKYTVMATSSAPYNYQHYFPPGRYKVRAQMTNSSLSNASTTPSAWYYCDNGNYLQFGGGSSGSWGSDIATSSDYAWVDQDFGLIGNYFRDVIKYLFYPSDENIQQFNGLSDEFKTKIPFSYYYEIRDTLADTSIVATSSVISIDLSFIGAGTVPFLSFDDIGSFKTAMGMLFNTLCWILLAMYFIFRIPTIL